MARYYRRKPTRKAVKPRNTSPLEADEQSLLFQWAEYAVCTYPELETMYHIGNGGFRNKIEASHLRQQGLKPGVPDICLPVPRGGYGALYIELKRRKGGRVSEVQKNFIALLNKYGNRAVVCKGFDEARQEIESYLNSGKG